MATEKHSPAAPAGNPLSRSGRLFARPIIEYGTAAALGGDHVHSMLSLGTQRRQDWIDSLPKPLNESEKDGQFLLRKALSEVEAWVLIERVRKAVRHG